SILAAVEKIKQEYGKVIFFGWSLSGPTGQRFVASNPELFKALAMVEAATCPIEPPEGIVNALVSNRIPFLNINGLGHSSDTGVSKETCQELVNTLKARGANATNI